MVRRLRNAFRGGSISKIWGRGMYIYLVMITFNFVGARTC